MAFAGGIVPAVAAMLFAVVAKLKARRGKRRVEPLDHLGRDRPRGSLAHRPYIEELSVWG